VDRDQIGSVGCFGLRSGTLKAHKLELSAARQRAVDCTRSAGFELADSNAAEDAGSTVIERVVSAGCTAEDGSAVLRQRVLVAPLLGNTPRLDLNRWPRADLQHRAHFGHSAGFENIP
jgi:hypothetical protein